MRWIRALLLLAAAAHGAGCGPDEITVHQVKDDQPGDYGRRALIEANAALEKDPRSPQAFATFAAKVAELEPKFTRAVELLAERLLVFGALAPMDAYADASATEQVKTLGVTVWPTAFENPARKDETPAAYVERMCGGPLAARCKYVVPEHRAMVLSRFAWKHLHERAGHALTDCQTCRYEDKWKKKLALYAKRDDESLGRLAKLGGGAETKAFAIAGHNAEGWTDPPLFTYDEAATFEGQSLPGGEWVQPLRRMRNGRRVMGLYLRPGARIAMFRTIAHDAAAAGFDEIALLVREPEYPYEKRAYRVSIGRRARGYKARVRDVESIQVMVQALDSAAETHKPPFRL